MVLVKPAYEFDPGHRFGTTDCDLLQKSTRGRSFFFSASCPLGLIRRHNDGSILLTMLRTRRTQVHNHGLCAHSGWGQPTRQNSAEIRRHDRRLACHGKLADGTRSDAWGHGEYGSVLEAGMEHLGGAVHMGVANAQHVPGFAIRERSLCWLSRLSAFPLCFAWARYAASCAVTAGRLLRNGS